MKLLPICVFILISLFVGGHTEDTLKCYKCENCYEVKDDEQTCTSETTTVSPNPSGPTTEATSTSSSSSSSSSEVVTNPTKPTTDTPKTTPDPSIDPPAPANLISNRFRREAHNITNFLRAAPTQHCYTIDILDGDKRKVNRGCIEVKEDEAACDILKDKFGSLDKCKICSTNKCNNSSPLKLSLAVFLMALVLRKIC